MNDPGDLTPPTPPVWTGGPVPPADNPPPPPAVPTGPASWWSRYRRFLIPAAGIAVIGVATAAVFLLVLKPAPTVERMVPASANTLLIANVDPSMTQKVNLMRALHAFPDLSTDTAISDKLDQALKTSGITFSGDIAPWLGAEVGLSAQFSLQNTNDTPAALYLVSRDDSKALAMLAKLRAGKWGSDYQWRDQTYDGFTISTGTPKAGELQGGAYAYVDHVALIASSAAVIDGIIDTEKGRTPRLVDSANYKATLSSLPSDRVAFLYVDGRSLVSSLKKGVALSPALGASSLKSLADLDAFQGVGATLSANGDGLLADMLIKVDQSKLTAATRDALSHAGTPNTVLRWVPRRSDAFLAFGGLKQGLQSLIDQAGSDPTVSTSTDAIGLTGPGGVLPHLSGEAGIELEVGARVIPAGAVLLGTDNPASMNSFLKKVLSLATDLGAQGGAGGSLMPSSSTPTSSLKVTVYRGVAITSYASAGMGTLGTAFQPSYAVADGMGILGSNLAEVKAVIDDHLGGSTIAGDPTYQTALAGALKQPSTVLYVNAGSLVDAVRRFSAESGLSSVDTKTLATIAPIKSVILTASSRADAMLERLFVVIQ
jgi:uncharacterized protein DUF3352